MRSIDDAKLRVQAEKFELDDKRKKLSDFIKSPAFIDIDQAQKDGLQLQLPIMDAYSQVLALRIRSFELQSKP